MKCEVWIKFQNYISFARTVAIGIENKLTSNSIIIFSSSGLSWKREINTLIYLLYIDELIYFYIDKCNLLFTISKIILTCRSINNLKFHVFFTIGTI